MEDLAVKEDLVVAEVALEDPDFIVYLLDPEQEYNCYFVVGNPELGKTERIGVVKKMLLAHSMVLRAELQDSKIAEKNDVKVIDIFPQTFKNLLRFVYGFDKTQVLSFDEADNLLYAAEKYMLPKLKNKLATRLMSLLDCNNICSLLNNPACFTVLELNSAITEILQLETEKVLASSPFLELSSSGFLKILEQAICNVDEIELWRSAIKWAKNTGKSEEGKILRTNLSEHLQHIRFCSMTNENIMTEVVPTKVLTYDEVIMVSESCSTGEVQPNLTTICNLTEKREQPLVKSDLLEQSLRRSESTWSGSNVTGTTFTLKTLDAAIELCSVQLYRGNMSSHECICTVLIQRERETPIIVMYVGQLDPASGWNIPIVSNEKNVKLLPNSTYLITFVFSCSHNHPCVYPSSSPYVVTGNNFSVNFHSHPCGYYLFQSEKICYKTLTKRVKSVESETPEADEEESISRG